MYKTIHFSLKKGAFGVILGLIVLKITYEVATLSFGGFIRTALSIMLLYLAGVLIYFGIKSFKTAPQITFTPDSLVIDLGNKTKIQRTAIEYINISKKWKELRYVDVMDVKYKVNTAHASGFRTEEFVLYNLDISSDELRKLVAEFLQ